ncbi:16S rRNA (adenine(1518)-N(6)/adenine(1519)-N(6))-dimethyltransferase RsmA [Patescibacteria group bacterium]|nr:16S rRNA (adenine(1518)-N(6)/adenine(1519)-N(6))-dimethyltransferase RsmA [Patescibacteria group bacterium]
MRPNSLLGQNFLISDFVLDSIEKNVLSLNKNSIENVVEIGGGFGFLTNKLLNLFSKVLVIEKDPILYEGLKKIKYTSFDNKMDVFLEDALDIYKKSYLEKKINDYFNNQKYCFVANIPYSITSRLIRNLLELEYKPDFLVFMVQKEVAERICAKPGSMSLLSVSCQFYADCEILFYVDKNSFYPEPKIDSAVLYLKPKKLPSIDINNFFRVSKIGFSSRRKKLIHNLSSGFLKDKVYFKEIFSKMGLDENVRAQNLSIEDWIELCYNIYV